MKLKFVRPLAALLLMSCGAAAQQAPTAPAPTPHDDTRQAPAPVSATIPDRNAFTFTAYDLNVILNPLSQSFTARGTLTLRNDSGAPQTHAVLQISSSLQWTSVLFKNQPLQFTATKIASDIDHTGAVNEAAVILPQPLPPGASIQLDVAYQGAIPQSAARLEQLGMPPELALSSDWDRISESFTGIRGAGYVTWYPVAIAPALLGDGNRVFDSLGKWRARHSDSVLRVRLSIAGKTNQTVLSSGKIAAHSPDAPLESPSFDISLRTGFEVPVIVVGDYAAMQTDAGEILKLGPGSSAVADKYAAAAANLLPNATRWFGPLRGKVRIIENPQPGAAPFESGATLLAPFTTAGHEAIELQLIHALAHAAVPSSRAWVSEGLAHYAQARMREQQEGRKAALIFLNERRAALALVEPEEPSAAGQSLVNATDEIFYRSKAMFVWWMLRDMVGEDTLRKVLAAYRPEFDQGPSYIQHLLEMESHRDLEWFFDDWVYRDRGLPEFRVANAHPRKNLNGTYLVTITVENLGNAGAEAPVRIITVSGEQVVRMEVRAKDKAVVRVNVPAPLLQVIVNDGSVPESDPGNNTFVMDSQTSQAPRQ